MTKIKHTDPKSEKFAQAAQAYSHAMWSKKQADLEFMRAAQELRGANEFYDSTLVSLTLAKKAEAEAEQALLNAKF